MHALARGDVATAWDRNPLAVLLLPLVLVAWGAWVLRTAGRDAWHPTRLPPRAVVALLILVAAFGVLRNLPGWAFLSPV